MLGTQRKTRAPDGGDRKRLIRSISINELNPFLRHLCSEHGIVVHTGPTPEARQHHADQRAGHTFSAGAGRGETITIAGAELIGGSGSDASQHRGRARRSFILAEASLRPRPEVGAPHCALWCSTSAWIGFTARLGGRPASDITAGQKAAMYRPPSSRASPREWPHCRRQQHRANCMVPPPTASPDGRSRRHDRFAAHFFLRRPARRTPVSGSPASPETLTSLRASVTRAARDGQRSQYTEEQRE